MRTRVKFRSLALDTMQRRLFRNAIGPDTARQWQFIRRPPGREDRYVAFRYNGSQRHFFDGSFAEVLEQIRLYELGPQTGKGHDD